MGKLPDSKKVAKDYAEKLREEGLADAVLADPDTLMRTFSQVLDELGEVAFGKDFFDDELDELDKDGYENYEENLGDQFF